MQEWVDYTNTLVAEINSLRAENVSLRREIRNIANENDALRGRVNELTEENEELQRAVEHNEIALLNS